MVKNTDVKPESSVEENSPESPRLTLADILVGLARLILENGTSE